LGRARRLDPVRRLKRLAPRVNVGPTANPLSAATALIQ